MYDESEKPHALVCTEIWGGNRKVIRTIKLPSLVAWVASAPIEEEGGGGDLHYMSVCDHDLISRVALADVSGHGHDVDAVAQTLRSLMREYINSWDQSDFMRGLNNTFGKDGNEKYATAIVLSFHRVTGRLAFSNAGHLPPMWYHAAQRAWGWLEEGTDPNAKKVSGLPVGLIPGSNYRQTVVTLKSSDLLVLYTDGITEAENGTGQDLGRQQLSLNGHAKLQRILRERWEKTCLNDWRCFGADSAATMKHFWCCNVKKNLFFSCWARLQTATHSAG